LAAIDRDPSDIVSNFGPSKQDCTVELVAVNAAMTAAPPEAMPLICATLEAMSDPDFNVNSLNATTASVTPSMIVNGSLRDRLGIAYKGGCLGGGGGTGGAIGRAIRLIVRNVAGQQVGVTSACVFGQPARITGLVFAEWEEESPWKPLAERRGVLGDAVTVFGAMGTANICDTVAERGEVIAEMIGKSAAYIGANSYTPANANMPGELVIAINPTWAQDVLANDFPAITDLQRAIWDNASLPIDRWPSEYRARMDALGRVDDTGVVHMVKSPDDVLVLVCGGKSSLHATMFHGFGRNLANTVAVPS
jgi:hypothetical protein